MNKHRAKRGYFIINNKSYSVYEGINIIGRNKEAAIIIKNKFVSHQHAILVITKHDHYLSDIKSINGTFIGDTKLIPFHLYTLSNKAAVKFATVNSTYYFTQDEGVILEDTQLPVVDDTIYCCTTQLYNSDVSINVQNELTKHDKQATPSVVDNIDLADIEIATAIYTDKLPTQKVSDAIYNNKLVNVQEPRILANYPPTEIDVSETKSIHELSTQMLCDITKVDELSEPHKTETYNESYQFCVSDAPTQLIQIINLDKTSGYVFDNNKSYNESVNNSIKDIDQTVLNDSILNKNDTLPESEVIHANRRNSVDLKSVTDINSRSHLHTSELKEKKGHLLKAAGDCSNHNEENTNKTMHKERNSSDKTSLKDLIKEKNNNSGVSKRKRNVITSDEDYCEIKNIFGKKEYTGSESQVHVSELSIRKQNFFSDEEDIETNRNIKHKRKSTESSDNTDIEIETKQVKKPIITYIQDKRNLGDDSSSDETDGESERNSIAISRLKKISFKTNRTNTNSNLFRSVVIEINQVESGSETDIRMENAKIDKSNGNKNVHNLTDTYDTDVIPTTPNFYESESDIFLNAKDTSKANKLCKNNLQSDLTLMHTQKSKVLDTKAIENELNLSNKFNNSDIIPAKPNCIKEQKEIKSGYHDSIFTQPTQNLKANDVFLGITNKIIETNDDLQAAQKLPPFHAELVPKHAMQITKTCLDKIENTINKDKDNDETSNKLVMDSPEFLKPKNVSDGSFLESTQKNLIECANTSDTRNDTTFLAAAENLVINSGNTTQNIEDTIEPIQPDSDDALFPEDAQLIDEKEVTFANQNVTLSEVNDFTENVDGHLEEVPTTINSVNNNINMKLNVKSKRSNSQLSNEEIDVTQNIKKSKKAILVNVKTTKKTRSCKTSINKTTSTKLINDDLQSSDGNDPSTTNTIVKQYVGAKLQRHRRNSAVKDNIIDKSIMNNNNDETVNSNESGMVRFTEMRSMRSKAGNKPNNIELINENKMYGQRNKDISVSKKQLNVEGDSTKRSSTRTTKDSNIKKPTNNTNSALTENEINIDKHLIEPTMIRAKRTSRKNKLLSEEAKVDQSAHKSKIQLSNFISNTNDNKENTSKIETLPPIAIELNQEESSASEDDFFVKSPKSSKSETNVDSLPIRSKKLQGSVHIIENHERIREPKVVFTMLDSPELESIIRNLGGSIVDTVDACTVLLTGGVKRSQKLLSAVGQGKPICSPKWLHESKKLGKFIDPWDYILEDDEAEQKWKFSLKESLNRSTNKKLLKDYTCQLVVNSAQDALKGAIEASGGKCVTRAPSKKSTTTLVVVANPENRAKYARFLKQDPRPLIVASEAIFDGVLRQELNFEDHLLT